jgi:hypothetical protein
MSRLVFKQGGKYEFYLQLNIFVMRKASKMVPENKNRNEC